MNCSFVIEIIDKVVLIVADENRLILLSSHFVHIPPFRSAKHPPTLRLYTNKRRYVFSDFYYYYIHAYLLTFIFSNGSLLFLL